MKNKLFDLGGIMATVQTKSSRTCHGWQGTTWRRWQVDRM